MTVKNAEDQVRTAEQQIEAAQEELERAQVELAKAQVVPAALATLVALKKTSHQVWEIGTLKQWDDESSALYEKAQSFEDELALLLLGAQARMDMLNELDPDRWKLEGEFKMRAAHYPRDEDVSHAIATAIFDRGFGRGSETTYSELEQSDRDRFNVFRDQAVNSCGEAGAQGFEFWRQGRHDT